MKSAWALSGLVLLVLFAFALDRGIYVGSRIIQGEMGQAPFATPTFGKQCRYLFISGVHEPRKQPGWFRQADAENEFCRLFYSN